MSRVEAEKDSGPTAGSNGSMSSDFVVAQLCRQGRFALFGSRRRLSCMIASGLGPLLELSGLAYDDSDTSGIPGWNDVDMMTPKEREEAGIAGDDYDPTDVPDFDEAGILDLLTPKERK
jgi:hypothetical protein